MQGCFNLAGSLRFGMQLKVVAAALLLALPGGALRAEDQAVAAASTPSTADLPLITVVPAQTQPVTARVPVTGSLIARKEVQINAQVQGYEITQIEADVGDYVKAGELLATFASDTLTALLAQAEAEFQRASASVSQADSQITSAEASLLQAAQTLERTQSLRKSGNASQAVLDQAVAAEASARAMANSARDGAAVARAALAQATAARDIARLNFGHSRITAPVDGLVVARSAELGAIPGVQGAPLFTLIAEGEIEFRGEVIESALPALKPGQRLELQVAGIGQVTGTARIVPVSVDAQTRLGILRASLEPDPRLRAGIFASGWIITDQHDAVTVPVSAVLVNDDGEWVQVVMDGQIATRAVKAGLIWQGRREILEGISAGDQVVARAGAFFRDGDKIRPLLADASGVPLAPPADTAVAPGADTAGQTP